MSKFINLGHIEDGQPLGLDITSLVDSRMLIQGNSGGGKSWLLRLLCERAASQVPIIVLDPEGEFASLREKLDVVLVGNDGEIATDVRSAGLLARKLIELEVSAVIDLYELKPQQRREYVKLFLEALVELPRSLWRPTLICLDEAHKFCPEKGTGEAVSTQAVIDLMSLGRKRGYAGILATQRFSKLHNDAIAETNNVFIGRTWLDADQKRAGEYLGMAPADRRALRDLGKGEFYAFGPALTVGGVNRFTSDVVATTHPKPGERHKLKPPKASDAIRHIVSQLADLPQQAEREAHDLASAEKRIRELERELKTRPQPSPATTEIVEVPIIKPAELKRIEAALAKLITLSERSEKERDKLIELSQMYEAARLEARAACDELKTALAISATPMRSAPVAPLPSVASRSRAAAAARAPRASQPSQASSSASSSDLVISKTQQRILNALAWYESIGNPEPSNLQIGAVALIDASGGHYSNTVGPLSSAGLIHRGEGRMRLTDAGRTLASVPKRVGTLGEYHNVLRERVLKVRSASKRTVDILNAIIEYGGNEISNEEIGNIVGIDYTGGHFSNTIGPLSTLGLIERRGGVVRPTEILFPKGIS